MKQEKKIGNIVLNSILVVLLLGLCVMQIGYLTIGRNYAFEYVRDSLLYLVNQLILLALLLLGLRLLKQKKKAKIVLSIFLGIATILNLVFLFHMGLDNRSIIQFSKDFRHQLVLKQNKETGETKIYKNAMIVFARPKEQFSYTVKDKIKTQWLANDICAITYQDTNQILHQYVATYGDRGDGISYYYVAAVIEGVWTTKTANSSGMTIKKDTKGITITQDGKEERFDFQGCMQYGTLAIVLSHQGIPKWTIVLKEDATLDTKTNLVQQDGTISLCAVSMEKTASIDFYRISK